MIENEELIYRDFRKMGNDPLFLRRKHERANKQAQQEEEELERIEAQRAKVYKQVDEMRAKASKKIFD
jgi:hypothetical protein